MKWARRLLLALVTLLVSLASFGLWLASESGSRWLLNQWPQKLQYQSLDGSLLEGLTLRGVELHHQTHSAHMAQVILHWDPLALVHGTLHIKQVAISQLLLAPAPANDTAATPLERLPNLVLPLALRIDRFSVEDLSLRSPDAPQAPAALLLQRLQFSATARLSRIELKQLLLEHPQGRLSLNGSIGLLGDYPLDLRSQWQLELPQLGALGGTGTITATLIQPRLQQQLSGAFNAAISAELSPFAPQLPWNSTISSRQLDLSRWVPELQGRLLDINAQLQGSLAEVNGDLSLATQDPQLGPVQLHSQVHWQSNLIDLIQLQLRVPNQQTLLQSRGQITPPWNTPHLALSGNWQGLRYPLVGEPEYRSTQGTYTFNGKLQDYRIGLRGDLIPAGSLPAQRLQLAGSGNREGLQRLSLQTEGEQGLLDYQGSLLWSPQLHWHGTLLGQRINPASLVAEWPGELELALDTQGSLGEQTQLSATIHTLSGHLRGEQIQTQGQLQWTPQQLQLDTLRLALASGPKAELSGRVSDTLDLNWQLDAQPLPPWLKGLSGDVQAHGTLKGPRSQPRLHAKLLAQGLHYNQLGAKTVRGSLDLSLDPAQAANVRLSVKAPALRSAEQTLHWEQLQLSLNGTLAQHRLRVQLEGAPLAGVLTSQGGWSDDHWQGRIRTLQLQSGPLGTWELIRPLALTFDSLQLEFDNACLRQQSAQLCLDVRQQFDGGGELQANLQGLSLDRLVGADVPTPIEGLISASGSLQRQADGAFTTQLEAALQGGRVQLQPALWLELDDLRARIGGNQQQLRLESAATLADLKGELALQATLQDPLAGQQLQGRIQGALQDLQLVSVFEPNIQNPTGHLNVDLSLGGTLPQPQLTGHINLQDGALELPATATQIRAINLQLTDSASNNNRLLISGSAESGGGTLALNGILDASKRLLHFTLSGDNFLASATPEANVRVSPRIELSLAPDGLQLQGDLLIPSATLAPLTLEEKLNPSSDVIFQEQLDADQPLFSYDLSLRLILGDKVRFKGYGIEAQLQGDLLLEEDRQRGTRATGNVQVASGQYRLYGQDLLIERGRFVYSGGPLDNPGLDLRISRTVDPVKVGAVINGTLQDSHLTLFSTPAMPDSELLSYLILGRPPGTNTADEQDLALRAAIALGMSGGNKLGEKLTETLPIDEIGFETQTQENTAFYVGKYLSPRLYIRYGMGLIEPTSTFLMRYKLSSKWDFESKTGTYSSAADLFYTIER